MQSDSLMLYGGRCGQGGICFRAKQSKVSSNYNRLLQEITENIPTLASLAQNTQPNTALREWAWEANNVGLEYQFRRYAKYLRYGTLMPLLAEEPCY